MTALGTTKKEPVDEKLPKRNTVILRGKRRSHGDKMREEEGSRGSYL